MAIHWGGRGYGHVSRLAIAAVISAVNTVPPSIAGTLTDGSTLTATAGTWSSGTATGQWYRDSSAISGQTASTYTYVAATDDGKYIQYVETNGAATATSNALIAGQNVTYYSTSFAGTNGTEFVGWDGWASDSYMPTGKLQLYGNDLRQTTGANAKYYQHSTGSNDHEIEFTTTVPVATNGDGSSFRYIFARFTSTSDTVELRIQNNGWSLLRQASGETTLQSFIGFGRNLVTGDKVKLRVSGTRARVYFNGIETSQSAAAGSGAGYDISGVSSSSKVAFSPTSNAGATTYPFIVATDIAINNIATNSISIASSTVESVAGVIGQQIIRLTGSTVGTVTQLQALVLSSAGKVLLDWANVSGLSGSAFNSVTANLPQSAEGGNVTVWMRDSTNVYTATSSVVAVPVAAQQVNMTHGMNASGFAYLSDSLMNAAQLRGKRQGGFRNIWTARANDVINTSTSVAYSAPEDFGLDQNEFPTQFPNAVSGYDASPTVDYPFFFFNFASGAHPSLQGVYDVTFTPKMRWDVSIAGGNNALVRSNYNEAAGTATLTVGSDTGSNPGIDFKGYDDGSGYVAGTMPPAGVGYFRAVKQGTDGKLLKSNVKNSLSGLISKGASSGYSRWMTELECNRASLIGVAYGERDLLPQTGRFCRATTAPLVSYDEILEFALASGTNVWLNIPDNASPTFIAAAAAYWRDNLPTGYKLALEYSNECWNFSAAFGQSTTLLYSVPNFTGGNLALSDGDYVKGQTSGKIRKIGKQVITSGTVGGSNAAGYLIIRTASTNSGFTSGETLDKCDSAGTVITSAIATVSAVDSGHHVRYARRVKWMLDLFEATFGVSDPRLEPVLAWQSVAGTSIFNQMLDEQGLYNKVKKFAIGPYIGGGIGTGGKLGDYNDQTIFTQAQRDAVVSSGKTQFKTNAFSAQATMGTSLVEPFWRSFVSGLAQYCVSKGLARTAIRPAAYEYMWQHIIEANTPTASSQKTLTLEAFAEMLRDSRAGTAQNAQNTWLQYTGGDMVGFSHILNTGASLSPYGAWGYCDAIGSEAQEPYASTAAWITANL